MNIIIWGVRIIEDSDNRGSDNRGCTVATQYKLRSVKNTFLYMNLKRLWISYKGYCVFLENKCEVESYSHGCQIYWLFLMYSKLSYSLFFLLPTESNSVEKEEHSVVYCPGAIILRSVNNLTFDHVNT